MRSQVIAEVQAFGQLEDARIVNDARADIAAAERDDPAPPAVSHQVVGRPIAAGPAGIRVLAKFFAPLIAVPVFDSAEPSPDGVDGMLGVLPEVAELSGEHGGASAGVYEPAGGYRGFTFIGPVGHMGPIRVELEARHLCGPL